MLNKFTSLFYESTPAPAKEPPPKEKAKPAAVAATPVASPPKVPVGIPGQVDPEMAQILENAIQEANIPGFDYIEFREVWSNMMSLGLPEAKLYQAAFASAQIAKITKQQLLEAIDFYIKVIGEKAKEFDSYVATLELTDVSGKDQAIADLDLLINAEAVQIQQLTALIGERRKQQDILRMEKAQADLDLKNKRAAFESTQVTIVGRLASDRTKIETFIQ